MDPMTLTPPYEQQYKMPKSQQYPVPPQTNYIDAEPPPGYRDYGEYAVQRLKKTRVCCHDNFIYIYQNDDGKWEINTSASLKALKKEIASKTIPFLEAGSSDTCDDNSFHQAPPEPVRVMMEVPREGSISYPFNVAKRRRMNNEPIESSDHGDVNEKRSNRKQSKSSTSRKSKPQDRQMIQIRMDEAEKWDAWFTDAFKEIQQTACRSIAKEWIRTIHPKKQSTHPYNGNMPRQGPKSPERTKPPYWPDDVQHKEPDHIDKTARIKLLVHLLTRTPQPEILPNKPSEKSFSAKDLLAVLEQKQDEYVTPKLDLIREVILVRTALENYEDGGTDADATMDVVDWSESTRISIASKKRKGTSSKMGDETESTYQDDADTPVPTPNDEGTDDDNMTTVQDAMSNMNTSGSFCSNASSQNCDDILQASTRTRHAHDQQFRTVPSEIHGYNVTPNPVNQSALRMNHLDPSISFRMTHGISNEVHYNHPAWSVAPPAGGELAPSYNTEGMMMVPGPMMDHTQFGNSIALRPRDARDVHAMMAPGPLNPASQYFHYQMTNHEAPQHRNQSQRVEDPNGYYDVYQR